jgi:D-xylose transport system permease protein
MSSAATATVPPAEAAAKGAPTLVAYVRSYQARLRGGEMGALPAVLGLLVLVTAFSILRPRFFTPLNFANLIAQGAAVMVIAMGLVFVLLLGEIDLSAGFTSGVCASIMSVLLVQHGWSWYLSILAALVTGTVIGTILGFLVAKVGIPRSW